MFFKFLTEVVQSRQSRYNVHHPILTERGCQFVLFFIKQLLGYQKKRRERSIVKVKLANLAQFRSKTNQTVQSNENQSWILSNSNRDLSQISRVWHQLLLHRALGLVPTNLKDENARRMNISKYHLIAVISADGFVAWIEGVIKNRQLTEWVLVMGQRSEGMGLKWSTKYQNTRFCSGPADMKIGPI